MKSDNRTRWVRERFGDIDKDTLGNISDVREITWPDIVEEHEINGRKLVYQMVKNIDTEAERVAEIYHNGIDEMVENGEYEWHHDPLAIIENVKSGDWNFYGAYLDGVLAEVLSLHIIRGQRTMHWVWGCVDPEYRGFGIIENISKYYDKVTESSGAQSCIAWMVTSHWHSQKAVEAAGYKPIGCFVGSEFFGGSDGHYYRANVIWYGKVYGNAAKHVQKWGSMKLTEKSQRLVNVVRELWEGE